MIRIRIVDEEEMCDTSKYVIYKEEMFYRLLEDDLPFRDEESVRLIHEIDQARFVEGDSYSMITPFGRTCLSALCGGTKYGLTALDAARKGKYISWKSVGSNVWKLLADLTTDIKIAANKNDYREWTFQLAIICGEVDAQIIIENFEFEGTIYDAILDEKIQRPELYSDTLHICSMSLEKKCMYKWEENINEIIEKYEKEKESPYIYRREQELRSDHFLPDKILKDKVTLIYIMNDEIMTLETEDPLILHIEKKENGTYGIWENNSEILSGSRYYQDVLKNIMKEASKGRSEKYWEKIEEHYMLVLDKSYMTGAYNLHSAVLGVDIYRDETNELIVEVSTGEYAVQNFVCKLKKYRQNLEVEEKGESV